MFKLAFQSPREIRVGDDLDHRAREITYHTSSGLIYIQIRHITVKWQGG